MTRESFDDWLRRYGAAWEGRDPETAATLFSADAEYYWTPFSPPKRGPSEIARAWAEATSRQRDIRFRCRVLGFDGRTGIAQWSTRLVRLHLGREVEIDGVLLAEFDGAGLCRVFREWWHGSESEDPAPRTTG
jgi:hypothetical protein